MRNLRIQGEKTSGSRWNPASIFSSPPSRGFSRRLMTWTIRLTWQRGCWKTSPCTFCINCYTFFYIVIIIIFLLFCDFFLLINKESANLIFCIQQSFKFVALYIIFFNILLVELSMYSITQTLSITFLNFYFFSKQ